MAAIGLMATAADTASSPIVWLNGQTLPLPEARVSVLDRGFLFGDGVYEVIRVYRGTPFLLDRHLERLQHSLDAVGIDNPHSLAEWKSVIERVIAANDGGERQVYLQVTRGVAPVRDHVFPDVPEPTVFVMAPSARPVPPEWVRDGIRALVLEDNRWGQCHIKSTMLLANVLLRQQAKEAGAEEALLVRNGVLTEGTACNVFIVDATGVVTPPKSQDMLPGITRDYLLELCRAHGQACHERRITENELRGATEIWITSSTRELLAVTTLDGTSVSNGRPGPVFERVYAWFRQALDEL